MARFEKATFGAGCFWHVQDAFDSIPGVKKTVAGFMGGWLKNPSYTLVCTHLTGHAEVVQVTYDPSKVSYSKLLDIFWTIHDPTQVNRQGLDFGTQYRSVIFFHTKQQERIAEASKKKLEETRKHPRPVATRIEPAKDFWPAEDRHQHYFRKKGVRACPATRI